mmetsp:Transcript_16104/g.24513  ORF Transcript_16104/g.24513 Transcript_16104/m.24513 type:complete len:380 (-) Transcript_16104:398-1537(-)
MDSSFTSIRTIVFLIFIIGCNNNLVCGWSTARLRSNGILTNKLVSPTDDMFGGCRCSQKGGFPRMIGVHLSNGNEPGDTKRFSFEPFASHEIRRWLSGGHAFAIGDPHREQNLQVALAQSPDTGDTFPVVRMFMLQEEAEYELGRILESRPKTDEQSELCVKRLPMDIVWCNMVEPLAEEEGKLQKSEPRYADGKKVEDNFQEVQYLLKSSQQAMIYAQRLAIASACPEALTDDDHRVLNSRGKASAEEYGKLYDKMASVTPKFKSAFNDIPVFYVDSMRLIVYDESDNEVEVFPVFLDMVEMLSSCFMLTGDQTQQKHPEVWDIKVMGLSEIVKDLSTGSSNVANFRMSGLMHRPGETFELKAGSLRAFVPLTYEAQE